MNSHHRAIVSYLEKLGATDIQLSVRGKHHQAAFFWGDKQHVYIMPGTPSDGLRGIKNGQCDIRHMLGIVKTEKTIGERRIPKERTRADKVLMPTLTLGKDWQSSLQRLSKKEIEMQPVQKIGKPAHEILEMTVSDWIAVPDNPRQRDTERHLRRAKHLLNPQPTHSRASMAVASNGERWKLDGHTRAMAWARGLVLRPPMIQVDVYSVRDAAAAAELYKLFDNQVAVETASDQVFGAYREHDFHPVPKLLQKANIANAVKFAEGLRQGRRDHLKDLSTYEAVGLWLNELTLFDHLHGDRKKFPGPIITVALMTFRKNGATATPFWGLYNDDGGEKIEEGMDAIEALTLYMMNTGVATTAAPIEIIGKALATYEAWENNKTYMNGQGVRGRDPTTYLNAGSRR